MANVLVCHRPRDLAGQNDDGTAASKIAAGLLADIETRVLLRQPAEEVPAMAELFDLSDREQQMLSVLPTGRAIWKIGAPLRGRPDRPLPDRGTALRHRPGDGA